MYIREEIENIEKRILSKEAILSVNTKGRDFHENLCPIRTEFHRDKDRIIHSKSFRRLKHKTQVFIAPEGDHFRTRLTHTLEVSQIGRTIAKALSLNEELVEAIALGHDLGHTPFGHTGERVLNRLHPNGFNHREQSIRVVEVLEHHPNRPGLNLTYEVKEGILTHSGDIRSETLEGQIVWYADRIAYINHDIDDSLRAGIIQEADIPERITRELGKSHSERINNMIINIIENSKNQDRITMSENFFQYTNELRNFMFENVYLNKKAKSQDDKAEYILEEIYNYYMYKGELPKNHVEIYKKIESVTKEDMICDYIAGMTDRYVINKFNKLFVPQSWSNY